MHSLGCLQKSDDGRHSTAASPKFEFEQIGCAVCSTPMMADAAPPRGTKRPTPNEVEKALAARVFTHTSNGRWDSISRARGIPALRKPTQALKKYLMSEFALSAHPIRSVRGAFFDFVPFLYNIIHDALLARTLPPPEAGKVKNLTVKLSVDGRNLRTKKNIGVFLTLLERLSATHSPWEQHTLAIFDLTDKELTAHAVWTEISLNAALLTLQQRYMVVRNAAFVIDTKLCADWKGLQYLIGFKAANVQGDVEICGWCGTHKSFIQNICDISDLYAIPPVKAKTVCSLPALTADDCRYCPMHGVNRMVDTCLENLYTHFHDEEVQVIASQVLPGWGAVKHFQVIDMKHFFTQSLHTQVIAHFADNTNKLQVKRPKSIESWATSELVARLMNACATYHRVVWANPPSPTDWQDLLHAREDILAVFWAFDWSLTPTLHYMTTHLFTLHNDDRNFFPWLQEGAEHHHQNDRSSASTLCGGGESVAGGRHCHVQVLETQELRRVLLTRGNTP
jgi:hypothetical protein